MITFADISMEKDLIEIWHKSFGDSIEYIHMFLQWNASGAKIIVYMIEDRPVSVAYLLPLVYRKAGEQDIPCWYLYAAATLPEYRGRGYFGDILNFIKEHVPEPVILVPAEQSLTRYYERQGLHVWQKEEVLSVEAGKKVQETINPECMLQRSCAQSHNATESLAHIDVQVYEAAREAYLHRMGYMKWYTHFLKYIFQENIICGGRQKSFEIEGRHYAVIYRIEEQCLKVLELIRMDGAYTMVQADEISNCAAALMKMTGCTSAQVCIRPPVMALGKLPSQPGEGYFNLTMG